MTTATMIDPSEFADTYREWHYLTAGFAVGVALGVLAGLHLTLSHVTE